MARKATNIDRHVATRLRAARLQAKLSQEEAGEKLGVTFQQIQKYENGHNRISASTLYHLAALYGVELAWFFDGAEKTNGKKIAEDIGAKLLATPHGIDIAMHYLALPGLPARQLVVDLAKALSRP